MPGCGSNNSIEILASHAVEFEDEVCAECQRWRLKSGYSFACSDAQRYRQRAPSAVNE